MAINKEDLFKELDGAKAAKKQWDAGVTFNRLNPVPLDKFTVFKTYDEASAYALTGAISYPGQTLAVIGDLSTTMYYIDTNGSLVKMASGGDAGAVEAKLNQEILDRKSGDDYLSDVISDEISGAISLSVGNLEKNLSVTVELCATAAAGMEATYYVSQGGVKVGQDINIPKDKVISGAYVVNVTGEYDESKTPAELSAFLVSYNQGETTKHVVKTVEPDLFGVINNAYSGEGGGDGKYLRITVTNAEALPVYIALPELVDTYVGAETDTISVGVNAGTREISAIVQSGSIGTAHLSADAVTNAKLADNAVQTENIKDANVTTAKIADAAIETGKIADSAVTTAKVNDSAITTAKINNAAVTSDKLGTGSVITEKISDGAVTTSKIADSNVTEAKLAAGSVSTLRVQDSAITTDKLAAESVTSAKLASSSVTEGKINTGAVTESKLAADAVTTVKIKDANVTTAKIADSNVTEAKIAADAVTTAKIKDGNVTTDKIADANVTEAKIAADAVTTAKIKDANVTTAKIAAKAVTTATIADNAVTSAQISADAVTTDKIKDGNVTSAKIADNAIIESKISADAVTTAKIKDANVTSAKIADNAIIESKISADAVTTAKIKDANVTTAKIADSNVTTAKIADANVTTAKIADANVTTAKIADSNVTTAKIADGNVTKAKLSTDVIAWGDGLSAKAVEVAGSNATTYTNTVSAALSTALTAEIKAEKDRAEGVEAAIAAEVHGLSGEVATISGDHETRLTAVETSVALLSSAMHFRGITTSEDAAISSLSVIPAGNTWYGNPSSPTNTPIDGDMVLNPATTFEYVWAGGNWGTTTTGKWNKMGDETLYVKKSDYDAKVAELTAADQYLSNAITAEVSRATGIESGLRSDTDEISGKTDNKVKVGTGHYDGTTWTDDLANKTSLSVVKIADEDYYKLIAAGKQNDDVLYIVSSDYVNGHDQRVINVGAASVDTDAVNLSGMTSALNALSSISGVCINNDITATVTNRVATLSIECISCGGAER